MPPTLAAIRAPAVAIPMVMRKEFDQSDVTPTRYFDHCRSFQRNLGNDQGRQLAKNSRANSFPMTSEETELHNFFSA